jgi:MFS family permease
MLMIGLIGLIIFTLYERKIEKPVLNIGVLGRNKVFVFSNISTTVFYLSSNALTFLLSLYLQYIQQYPPQKAGLILLISPVTMAIFSPAAGHLSDRFPSQIVAAIGMGFSCFCMVLFSLLDGSSKPVFIMTLMFLFGLATAIFSSPNSNAVMGSVEKRYLGVAAGTQGTSRTIGMVMSMGIVMILFTLIIGGAQITPEYYPAFLSCMKIDFVIFAIISFMGIFFQLAGRKKE